MRGVAPAPAVAPAAEPQVVVDGEVGEHLPALGHVGEPAAHRDGAGGRPARCPDSVLTRVDLPAPFGPISATSSPALDGQADAVERGRRRRTARRGPRPPALADSRAAPRRPRYAATPAGSARTSAGGALGDDPAEVEHGDPVGQPGHERDVVLDQHHGQAVGAQRRDAASARRCALRRAQAGRRLVEQQQPRPAAQRPGQLQRPLLAQRQRLGRPVGPRRQARPGPGTRAARSRIARSSRRWAGQPQRGRRRSPARVVACAPTITFSSAVIPRNTRAPWKTTRDAERGPPVRRQPVDPAARRTSTVPASGGSWPPIRLNSVDLPAPLGPMTPRSSPGATSRSTSRTAYTPPNERESPRRASGRPRVTCRSAWPAGSSPSRSARTRRP